MRQNGDMKQVQYRGSTNIRKHRKKNLVARRPGIRDLCTLQLKYECLLQRQSASNNNTGLC
jgi:hypothetical protein